MSGPPEDSASPFQDHSETGRSEDSVLSVKDSDAIVNWKF